MTTLKTVIDLAKEGIEATTGRFDSWRNALTGLGGSRDKLQATHFSEGRRLSIEELEQLYHGEDMASRICEALPQDALRRGFELEVEDEDDEANAQVQAEMKRLGAKQALFEAAVWSRVYGGACVVMGLDDGRKSWEPLDEEALRSVQWLTVLDRRSLIPATWYSNPLTDGPKYGWPSSYRVVNFAMISAANAGPVGTQARTPTRPASTDQLGDIVVHESRVLRFDGALTSIRRRMINEGWADSVIQRVYEVLIQHNIGWQGTAYLLQDASQGVFKIQGLIDMIAGGEKEALQTRMQLVDMSRSMARSLLIDADKEEFTRSAYSFTGVPDVIDRFMLRLAAAARMPVTVLYGRSPAGLNATGESDIRIWYDAVSAYQSDVLEEKIERLVHLVTIAKDSPVQLDPESWSVCFPSLWQPTKKEELEQDLTKAQTDKIYLDSQVVLPEEVALAADFPLRGAVDLEARRQMLKAELDLAKSKTGEEPTPPPMPGAPGVPPAATNVNTDDGGTDGNAQGNSPPASSR